MLTLLFCYTYKKVLLTKTVTFRHFYYDKNCHRLTCSFYYSYSWSLVHLSFTVSLSLLVSIVIFDKSCHFLTFSNFVSSVQALHSKRVTATKRCGTVFAIVKSVGTAKQAKPASGEPRAQTVKRQTLQTNGLHTRTGCLP